MQIDLDLGCSIILPAKVVAHQLLELLELSQGEASNFWTYHPVQDMDVL